MTEQQLYLDGQLMDLSEDTSVVLDIKSNLFRDITKMTASYTYTIQLPKTAHNMAVLQVAAKPVASTLYPYVFHTARYVRNGLDIIPNGRAAVLSAKDTIELSIYFGMFPAFLTLKESGMKLNELNIDKYLKFYSRSKPDTYEAAVDRGYFYADYNAAQVKGISEDWTGYDITRTADGTTEIYELTSGKIETGGTIGAHISGTVVADDAYICTSAPFTLGHVAEINGVVGSGAYRTWAVVDANGNILDVAEETTDNTPINVSVQAPATAARIIINACTTYSKGKILFVMPSRATPTAARTAQFSGSEQGKVGAIQPSVSCRYILQQIAADTGVQLDWSEEAKKTIDTLAIPLLSRKIDSNSVEGTFAATLGDTSEIDEPITIAVTQAATSVIWTEDTQLTVLPDDTSITFDVQMYWSWDASKAIPQGYRTWTNADGTTSVVGVYTYPPYYIEMKVVSPQNDDQETIYVIGMTANDGKTPAKYITDLGNEMIDGRFVHLVAGHGTVDLVSGDRITFTVKNANGRRLSDLKCYNGVLRMSFAERDEVPYGGQFPIGKNLPEITVMDFIKSLCVITGSFPLQTTAGGALRLASIADVVGNRANAVDWTRKLVPNDGTNQPRETAFTISDYCQHNLYKWKTDDTVYDDHDGDMQIDNATMEQTRDVCTLPFAASDGNRVPIYEWEDFDYEVASMSQSGSITIKQQRATKYKACKDRILNLYKDSSGNAALRFDIDLQGLFDKTLKTFRDMIAKPKQIKEYIMLSDIDIQNFDETRPIYLAQYACYFLVLEIRTTNKGYSEVQLIKIN